MIKFNNVSFRYKHSNNREILKNINLKIDKGELILFCGESGSGKTTITRLINGLIPNYYNGELKGEVLIDNKKINEMPLYETGKIVGSVFQNPRSQFFNVDTTSELSFGCENQGWVIEKINYNVLKSVRDMKIEYLLNRNIFKLSGGEKQKIAFGSVYACEPEIFVLDEPTSNLDTRTIEYLRKIIKILKDKGKTIIIAEHRLYFLREMVDRLIYLKNGEIKEEIYSDKINNISNKEIRNMGLRPIDLNKFIKEENIINFDKTNKKEQIILKNFIFGYNKNKEIINIPRLNVDKNAVIAIIGNNGSGKTTFARCLSGLEKSCKGVLVSEKNEYNQKKRLKNSYLVMQDVNNQLFTETVFDEVLLSTKNEDVEKTEAILKKFNILKLKDAHPISLSGGQKQIVAIGSAAASDKNIIIFDEPTSGLDLKNMKIVSKAIKELQFMNKTVFLISHDIELILECCNSVIELNNGKVVENYPIDNIGKEKLLNFFLHQDKVIK